MIAEIYEKELFREIVKDVLDGRNLSFSEYAFASKFFSKNICDKIGVHYFDFTPQELISNPNRLVSPEVLKYFKVS